MKRPPRGAVCFPRFESTRTSNPGISGVPRLLRAALPTRNSDPQWLLLLRSSPSSFVARDRSLVTEFFLTPKRLASSSRVILK